MNSETHDAIPAESPFSLFGEWFEAARLSEANDPEAVALATATADGLPSVRMVLLKDWSPDGFVFYTNGHSRKGGELHDNPHAALLFHWKSLRRQIRIEGALAPVDDATADAYFASRSRDSQLGALASDQSAPLDRRETFLSRYAAAEQEFAGRDVVRPAHWTGFRLTPDQIEFWCDRDHRLHERRRFSRGPGGEWSSTLLFP